MANGLIDFTPNAVARGNQPPPLVAPGTNIPFPTNAYGEPVVAQGTPPYLEMARQGSLWIAQDGTPRAAVVAIPTVTAVSSLYNGEDQGGKCYVLDRITFSVVANTAAASFGIVLNLQKLATPAAPADVKTIASPSGVANYPGKARIQNGATAVAADLWIPIGNTAGNLVASGFGTAFDSGPLEGRFIVRPQRLLHAAVVASATNLTGNITFWWSELFIPGLVN